MTAPVRLLESNSGFDALGTTLAVSMIIDNSGRTNIMLGAVHLVLFGFYILLIFD